MIIIPTEHATGNNTVCDYVTIADLESEGYGVDDVKRHCPGAVELVSLGGQPCWLADDLIPLLGGADE